MDEEKSSYINSVNLNSRTGFPYLVLDVVDDTPSRRNPGFRVMHWHEDLQFIYVAGGAVEIRTLRETEKLSQGEAVFINNNVVHCVQRVGSCHYNSFIFPAFFLKFYDGSPAGSLVDNVTANEKITILRIAPESEWQKKILAALRRLAALEKDKTAFSYTYEVLVNLSCIWLTMCMNMKIPSGLEADAASLRVQKVLRYIDQHYAEELTLSDLSESASISRSECTRCFRQCLGTTPYQYLLVYRLSKAAQLLKNTDMSIGDICADVGFQQMSHFGKCFREKTGLSPRDYRRAGRK